MLECRPWLTSRHTQSPEEKHSHSKLVTNIIVCFFYRTIFRVLGFQKCNIKHHLDYNSREFSDFMIEFMIRILVFLFNKWLEICTTLTPILYLLRMLVRKAIRAPGRQARQQLSSLSWATWQARMQGTNVPQRPGGERCFIIFLLCYTVGKLQHVPIELI